MIPTHLIALAVQIFLPNPHLMNSAGDQISVSAPGHPRLADFASQPGSARWMTLAAGFVLLLMYTLYPAYPTTGGLTLAGWTWDACNDDNGDRDEDVRWRHLWSSPRQTREYGVVLGRCVRW